MYNQGCLHFIDRDSKTLEDTLQFRLLSKQGEVAIVSQSISIILIIRINKSFVLFHEGLAFNYCG